MRPSSIAGFRGVISYMYSRKAPVVDPAGWVPAGKSKAQEGEFAWLEDNGQGAGSEGPWGAAACVFLDRGAAAL